MKEEKSGGVVGEEDACGDGKMVESKNWLNRRAFHRIFINFGKYVNVTCSLYILCF